MAQSNFCNIENINKWNNTFINLSKRQRDIYFTPEYYMLYKNLGEGDIDCFIYEENTNIAIYPFLINSINSLGYCLDKEYKDVQGAYGYNGICTNCSEKIFLNNFYRNFDQYCNDNNIIAEFTRFHPIFQNHQFADSK